jgi:type IV pilus assembly protein PilQ
MVKGVEIKPFKELNALILSGGTPQIIEITEFLRAIDKPVVNVMIDVIVVEARKGHSVNTGIKAGVGDSTVTTKGTLFPGIDLTLSSKSINNIIDKLDGKTGIVNLGKVAPNFYVTLEALEQNNKLDIQSTPKLSTLNGHEANLQIGQSRYYLEQTQNITGGVTPINSLSQRWNKVEANLAVKILPAVAGDEHITLHIEAEFSDFVEPQVTGAPPGNSTRKFVSEIRMRNEEMIVLGGLEEARNQKSGTGVPILSRIPILKWFFSSRSTSKSETKLIVFIKPTIVY